MTNVSVEIVGNVGYGTLPDGHTFSFDAEQVNIVTSQKWYYCFNKKYQLGYIYNKDGVPLHQLLAFHQKGLEVDHINLDTMDNRSSNLRLVTHQQNQINQPLQSNNTSGVSGVSYYPPRKKYRARIKIGQHDIHLGYYPTFQEAVQARNVGMKCMFGDYGRYDDVPPAPFWIKEKVFNQCKRFAELSICRAFLVECEETAIREA